MKRDGGSAPVDLEAFGGMLPSWPHFPGDVSYRQFVPQPGERPGAGLWRVLEAGVHERRIPVTLDAPIVELVTAVSKTDPSLSPLTD